VKAIVFQTYFVTDGIFKISTVLRHSFLRIQNPNKVNHATNIKYVMRRFKNRTEKGREEEWVWKLMTETQRCSDILL